MEACFRTVFPSFSNQPVSVLARWQKPGDVKPIQQFTTYEDSYVTSSNYEYADASYIRLKNISLSYKLPAKWGIKYLLNSTIYFQGQNIFTITRYNGLDPENGSFFHTTSFVPIRFWSETKYLII